jgi:HSP20 family molecular chaperone IbpA
MFKKQIGTPEKNGGVRMMMRPGFWGETLMDEFINDFSHPSKNVTRYRVVDSSVMKTDIRETENGYELDIELPGYKKEDVQAELKDGNLVITAKHHTQSDNQKKNYIRQERFWGTCSRSFFVGEEVKQQDIRARFEDGILKLLVPKKKEVPQVEVSNFINIE